MNKKTLYQTGIATLVASLAVAGTAYAASIDATSKLGGNSGDFFTFAGTGTFDSIKIGKQGVGGVTFFNGTIVNETTNDGVDNPVTFGDDVRIDGRIHRGTNAGPATAAGEGDDKLPVIVNDDFQVEGVSNFNGKTNLNGDTMITNPTWNAQTRKIAVPRTAIQPFVTDSSAATYSSAQEYIVDFTASGFTNVKDVTKGGASVNDYYAPVHLPHGATVSELKAYYNDATAAADATIKLVRMAHGGTSMETMAQVQSSGSAGTGNGMDDSIDNAAVDNDMYTYFVHYNFADYAGTDLGMQEVEITYTTTMP